MGRQHVGYMSGEHDLRYCDEQTSGRINSRRRVRRTVADESMTIGSYERSRLRSSFGRSCFPRRRQGLAKLDQEEAQRAVPLRPGPLKAGLRVQPGAVPA
jgi:hypothetical protein